VTAGVVFFFNLNELNLFSVTLVAFLVLGAGPFQDGRAVI